MAEEENLADAVSHDRIGLLDLDDLTKLLDEAKVTEESLKLQIDELNYQMQQCIEILSSNHLIESSNFDRYSLAHSDSLSQFVDSTNLIAIHRLLGMECFSLTQNRYNITVSCYEDNYPTLPLKLLQIQQSHDSDAYMIRPKEILFHLNLDDQIQQTMMGASWQEIVQCIRTLQSSIFDSVAHENVFTALKTHEAIRYSLNAQRNSLGISFALPTDWHIKNDTPLKLESILLNHVSIFLEPPTPSSNYRWTAKLMNHSSGKHKIPASVSSHLREFVKSLKTKSVVQCVDTLMNNYRLEQITASSPVFSSDRDEDLVVW